MVKEHDVTVKDWWKQQNRNFEARDLKTEGKYKPTIVVFWGSLGGFRGNFLY